MGALHGGGLPGLLPDRMDHRLGTGRVGEQMKGDSYYYQSNIDKLLTAAERKVEKLKIQKEIFAINAKLKMLEDMHPAQKTTEEEPSALDTPASSLQGEEEC